MRVVVPRSISARCAPTASSTPRWGLASVKPGDVYRRELRLMAIAGQDIAKLQLRGGDRCDRGGLNKFCEPNGQCLALALALVQVQVQALPNKPLTFNK